MCLWFGVKWDSEPILILLGTHSKGGGGGFNNTIWTELELNAGGDALSVAQFTFHSTDGHISPDQSAHYLLSNLGQNEAPGETEARSM